LTLQKEQQITDLYKTVGTKSRSKYNPSRQTSL